MRGIDEQERAYLHYKPSLVYNKKILSFVTEDTAYEPSSVVDKLLNKKPSGLLGEIEEAKLFNEMMLKRLEKCLEDTNVNGITVSEYMKNARDADGDKELVRQFDRSNAMAINGTSQAECLPLLLEMESELDFLSANLNKHFYNNEANLEHLEIAEEKDNARLEMLMKKDMAGNINKKEFDNIGFDSVVLEVTSRRLDNCKKMSKELNGLLCTTVNTYYNGNVDDVVQKFGEADVATLDSMNEANVISFRKTSKLAQEDTLRSSKLNSPQIKNNLQDMFARVGELKQKSNQVLDWALSIDTDYDQNSYTQIVADAFDQVEFINEEYEKATLEMFKQIKLDEIVKIDIVSTMQQKRYERQKIALLSDIIKEKESDTFDPQEFVDARNLRSPGTMCSK